jgi:hypothetical protein
MHTRCNKTNDVDGNEAEYQCVMNTGANECDVGDEMRYSSRV